MKTNNAIRFLALSLLILAYSCVRLDTAPYDRETDITYWETNPNAAIEALNTCYTYLASMDELIYSEGMTDNAYSKQPNDATQNIGNGSFSTADSYVKLVWDSRYTGIRICNQLLENIDRVPNLSNELKARYIGEAKVIRAYHYYELYTKFGAVPYTTKVMSIKESMTISRTSRSEVVSSILTELDEVISNNYLPFSYGSTDKGRITHWAALAIKAKIYLFESNWDKVKEITAEIIEKGEFHLFESYSGLFEINNEYNPEVILDAQYRPTSREHQMMYVFLPPSLGGYAKIAPLQSLIDNYIMINGKAIHESGSNYDENNPYKDRDPRMKASVIYTGNSYTKSDGTNLIINCQSGEDSYGFASNSTPTGYYIKKYWDNTYRATLYSGLNPIIIRYADVLLMNAEASAELGVFDEKVWNLTIKPIRERAGFKNQEALAFPTHASSQDLKNLVRSERRSEFAFEGLRHKDIMRWRLAENVLNGWCYGFYTGDVSGADNGYVRIEERLFDRSKHYLWPIPQAERDLNKNLEQNPNW